MSDIYKVITPENIELDYDLAGIGSRFLAIAVDFLIQTATLIGIYAILHFMNVGNKLNDKIPSIHISMFGALMILLILVINFGYFIVLELAMNGQTVGKKIFNLRVRKEQGYAPGFWDILLRNIIRPIDFLPFFYAVGFITMFLNCNSKRLGDFAAGTIVVKETPRKKITQFLEVNPVTFPDTEATQANYPWLSEVASAMSEQDYLLLKDLLSRKKDLINYNQLTHGAIRKIITNAISDESVWMMYDYAPDVLIYLIKSYEKIHLI